jgi:hypothetical protein
MLSSTFAGGRVLDVEGLPGSGRTPLAVNQQASRHGGQQRAFTLGRLLTSFYLQGV